MKLNHSIQGPTKEPMLTPKAETETKHWLYKNLLPALSGPLLSLASILASQNRTSDPPLREDLPSLDSAPESDSDIECARFPDQCPTTTELGKGIA